MPLHLMTDVGSNKNKLGLFTYHGEQQQQQHEQKQQDMQLFLESWIESELKCYWQEYLKIRK